MLFRFHLIVIFFLATSAALAQQFQPLLFKVSGNGLKQPSWVFGTYHLLGASYIDQFPAVKNALNEAKGIVVETRLSQANPYKMVAFLLMKDNSISAMLDTNAYAAVSDDLKRFYGTRLQTFDQMKPAVVSTMLLAAYAREWDTVISKNSGKELDAWFEVLGDSMKKQITPLESIDDQLRMLFLDTDEERQAADLVMLVNRKTSSAQSFNRMTRGYYSGNLDSIWAAVNQGDTDSVPFMDQERLLTARNRRWLGEVISLMKGSSQFVAVGAAHLAGPEGLITLLREKGYKVEQVKQ